MAANDTTLVNGVTKYEVDNGFFYYFPLATIQVNSTDGVITTELKEKPYTVTSVEFDSISEQYGAADSEEYVDYLANNRFFFELPANTAQMIYKDYQASLANGSSITSGWFVSEPFDKIQFSGYASGSGMTMRIESKINDSAAPTQLDTPETYTDGNFYMFNIIARQGYMRFSWENDTGGAYTDVSMELKGTFGSSDKLSVFPLGTQPSIFSQAGLVQSVNRGTDSNGDYINQRVTSLGANIGSDIRWETALGNIDGSETWNKFGYNNNIDSASEEVIASFGGTYTPPTTAETLDISSASANDTNSAGTGLRSVVITGIDSNRAKQVEVVNLNGTTTVTTVSTWLGINRVAPFLCGSLQTNDGDITVTNTTSGTTLALMPAGETVTQQAIFHVQANHTFQLTWLWFNVLKLSGGSAPKVTVKGWVFSPVANATILVFKASIDTDVENRIPIQYIEPFPVTEESVLYFTADTDTNNTIVDCRFSGIEVPNE